MTATIPPTATSAPIERALIVPDALWPSLRAWCDRHHIALHQRSRSPARMPVFEARRIEPPTPQRGRSGDQDLSERERQVLRLIADGFSNGDIGAQLHLSEHTIKSHVRRIMGKLGVHDRSGAVAVAFRQRILT